MPRMAGEFMTAQSRLAIDVTPARSAVAALIARARAAQAVFQRYSQAQLDEALKQVAQLERDRDVLLAGKTET